MNDKASSRGYTVREASSGRIVTAVFDRDDTISGWVLTSDQDCRLNYNFRTSPVIDKAKQRCAFELESLAKLRKEMARAHESAMREIRIQQAFIQSWYDAAIAESRRGKERRSVLSKEKLSFTRETCRQVGCYNPAYRNGLCSDCLRDNHIEVE